MSQPAKLNKQTTKGHAFFLYDTASGRLELLAEYFKQGLENNELCIFVTPEPPKVALQDFKAIGFDATTAYKQHSFRIFEMDATYLPGGQFVADYMLNNVRLFIEEAENLGYAGIRTAGEMSWLDEHPEAIDEATDYEYRVNGLSTPHDNFVGLCLYPAQSAFTSILTGAARSHPTYIHNSRVRPNPHFH